MGPAQTALAASHLDGCVLRVDGDVKSCAMLRFWGPANDLLLPNIDRQSFKGIDHDSSRNPSTGEPDLNRLVVISTNQTNNPASYTGNT